MRVYLDNAATTPIHPKVLEKMLPFLKEDFGNASSIHSFGRKGRVVIEEAREIIAGFLNADSGEIYFTSGGTEANNFTVRGIAKAEFKESGRKRIISSRQEHRCVKDSVKELKFEGYDTDYINTLPDGKTDIINSAPLITNDTSLITIIHTSNETGAVNDIKYIAGLLNNKDIYLHTDAVQSFGKTVIDVKELGISALTGSAHKINGPKGTGFAFIKSGTPVSPLIFGGAQERNRRGGTENVAGIAGLAEAVLLAKTSMNENWERVNALKSAMINGFQSIDKAGIQINSNPDSSPYILSVTFDSRFYKNDAEAMLMYLDINGVAVSNGAACSSGTYKPSHVILSMGKPIEDVNGTIRISFSADNNMDEINFALEVFKKMSLKFRRQA